MTCLGVLADTDYPVGVLACAGLGVGGAGSEACVAHHEGRIGLAFC